MMTSFSWLMKMDESFCQKRRKTIDAFSFQWLSICALRVQRNFFFARVVSPSLWRKVGVENYRVFGGASRTLVSFTRKSVTRAIKSMVNELDLKVDKFSKRRCPQQVRARYYSFILYLLEPTFQCTVENYKTQWSIFTYFCLIFCQQICYLNRFFRRFFKE